MTDKTVLNNSVIKTPGTLFIIAAPSGGGKTSLVNRLLEKDEHLKLSISHTTRPMRPKEENGKDYFFITPELFSAMVKKEAFLEHAEVFGYSYGTSSEQVLHALEKGLDVILEIDWQGAQQVRKLFDNVVSIFILPPSYEILLERLAQRGQDSAEIIQYRMEKAHHEIAHYPEFDFIVFNDDFDDCLKQIQSIITAQRLRYSQQSWRSIKRLLLLSQ